MTVLRVTVYAVVPLVFCWALWILNEDVTASAAFVVAGSSYFGWHILVAYWLNEEILYPIGGRVPAGGKTSFCRILVACYGVILLLVALYVILDLMPVRAEN